MNRRRTLFAARPGAPARRVGAGLIALTLACAVAPGAPCALAAEPPPRSDAGLDGAVYLAPAHPDYFPDPLYVRLEVRGDRLYGHARPVVRPGAPERQILADFVEERGEFVLGRLYAPARERSFRARIWRRDGRLFVRVYDDYNYRTLEFPAAP